MTIPLVHTSSLADRNRPILSQLLRPFSSEALLLVHHGAVDVPAISRVVPSI